jgi:NADH:ubiquinone oxidoreductase subunit 6 (subunit J)
MSFEVILFVALALLAIICAMGMILSKNAVHSALFLVANFACVAVLYIMLGAPFLGMVQIAVYAGAIMVLFLFVIMLLGAEQTTDTTRTFRGLSIFSTAFALFLLVVFAGYFLVNAFVLPTITNTTAHVRVVHVAGLPDNAPVNISISGANLPEPLTIESAAYGAITPFYDLPAGDYTVTLTDAEAGSPVAPPTNITVVAGFSTVLAHGLLNLSDSQLPELTVLPQSVDPSNDDYVVRLLVANVYSDSPVSLIDLGPNDVVDTRSRPQFDEQGNPILDEQGNPVTVLGLADPVLVGNVEPGTLSAPTNYAPGAYNLAFVDSNFQLVKDLPEYVLHKNSEQLVILGADYEEPLAGDADSTYRPRILRDEALNMDLNARFGSPASIGQILFTDFLLPVNVVGLLLLVALVGVVVLTRPDTEKSERRVTTRRKVSRPLVSVITQQTGSDVVADDKPRLPSQSGD